MPDFDFKNRLAKIVTALFSQIISSAVVLGFFIWGFMEGIDGPLSAFMSGHLLQKANLISGKFLESFFYLGITDAAMVIAIVIVGISRFFPKGLSHVFTGLGVASALVLPGVLMKWIVDNTLGFAFVRDQAMLQCFTTIGFILFLSLGLSIQGKIAGAMKKNAEIHPKPTAEEKKKINFFYALKKKNLSAMEKIVQKAKKPEDFRFTWKNYLGETPLIACVNQNYIEGLEFLLSKGAKINQKDAKGFTPLQIAVKDNQLPIAKLLLEKGADPNEDDPEKFPPLCRASKAEKWEMMELLLEKGAAVDGLGPKGATALLICLENQKKKAADFLIKKGASLTTSDTDGYNALYYASTWGYLDIITQCLDQGMNVNQKTPHGTTPIIKAVSRDQKAAVEVLAARGADLKVKNEKGEGLLQIAASSENQEMVTLLRSLGVKGTITALAKTFVPFSRGCREELKVILNALTRTLDAKKFIVTLTNLGFKFDEENQIGIFFRSLNGIIVFAASSNFRIFSCTYAQDGGGPGTNIPLVESQGHGLGKVLYPDIYIIEAGDEPDLKDRRVEFNAATDILVFNKDQGANFKNRYIYDKAVFNKGLAPQTSVWFLKRQDSMASYPYLVVQTGDYKKMASVKMGSDYGKTIFSQCFPDKDPAQDWAQICGEEVVGNFAPEGYDITKYDLYDELAAEILDGRYSIEKVLK